MSRERLLTVPLSLALLAAAVLLGLAGYERYRPRSFAEVVQALRDGDCEGYERRAMLLLVEEYGASSPNRVERLAAAMAAIARADDGAYRRYTGVAAGQSPIEAADVALLDVASCDTVAFGDDVLRRLLEGWLAEARGERDAARVRFEQVAQSAQLFRMPLAATLCTESLLRLR